MSTDYSEYVLRVDFSDVGHGKVDLPIERIPADGPQNCSHCLDKADYVVRAGSGYDMEWCQEYFDNAFTNPSFPDEFVLKGSAK